MMAREVGDAVGVLMNAEPGSVSLHLNVTSCQAVVASCFDFSGRAQQSRLQRHEFSLRHVLLGGAALAWRARPHGSYR